MHAAQSSVKKGETLIDTALTLNAMHPDAIVIRPAPQRSLLAVLKTLKPLEESFPDIPELPAEPVDL